MNIFADDLRENMGLDENGELRMSGSKFIVKLVELMLDKDIRINKIKFHTSNFVGFENMRGTLNGAINRGFIGYIEVDNRLTDYLSVIKQK